MRLLGQGHGLVYTTVDSTTRGRSVLWAVPQRPSTERQYSECCREASRVGLSTLLRRGRRSLAAHHWHHSRTGLDLGPELQVDCCDRTLNRDITFQC
eukprot:1179778-Rhodomonas_salina.5